MSFTIYYFKESSNKIKYLIGFNFGRRESFQICGLFFLESLVDLFFKHDRELAMIF